MLNISVQHFIDSAKNGALEFCSDAVFFMRNHKKRSSYHQTRTPSIFNVKQIQLQIWYRYYVQILVMHNFCSNVLIKIPLNYNKTPKHRKFLLLHPHFALFLAYFELDVDFIHINETSLELSFQDGHFGVSHDDDRRIYQP